MPHCCIDFTNLQRPEQVVALMIAGTLHNNDRWSLLGTIPTHLQRVLARTGVDWASCDQIPRDAIDMTESVVRVTELERGLARYVYRSRYCAIAISFINQRYRVVVANDPFGSFASPREALAALHRAEAQALPIDDVHTLADCAIPDDLSAWQIERFPEPGPAAAGIGGRGDGSVGLVRAALQTAMTTFEDS